MKNKKTPEVDTSLNEIEKVPLHESVQDYFAREVLPHVPDAWIDESKTDDIDGEIGIVGYEINFNRYFYEYVAPRPLDEIDADLRAAEAEIAALLKKVIRGVNRTTSKRQSLAKSSFMKAPMEENEQMFNIIKKCSG